MTKEQLNDCAETLLETVQETITDTIDFYLENNNYQFGENFETEEKIYKILINKLKEQL
jgi:6-pyruvoyl-tetrahydropterin synthase